MKSGNLLSILILLMVFMGFLPLQLIRSSRKLRMEASSDAWKRLGMGMGIGIGMLLGLAAGLVIDNLFIGVSIGPVLGVCAGLAAGALLEKKAGNRSRTGEGPDESPAGRCLTLLAFGIAATGVVTVVLYLFFTVSGPGR